MGATSSSSCAGTAFGQNSRRLMMTLSQDPVLAVVNGANQRGGRMLSVIDLLDAGTIDEAGAALVLDAIARGGSWLVGAVPGGAGKTTVMGAFLAMLPAGEPVCVTRPGSGWEQSAAGTCIVAHEISPGGYDGYIWGDDLKRYAALRRSGCRLVANLHADTTEEAEAQFAQNGLPAGDRGAFDLFIPIRVGRTPSGRTRVIPEIRRRVAGNWASVPLPVSAQPDSAVESIMAFLTDCRRKDIRLVEDVRPAWLRWAAGRDPS